MLKKTILILASAISFNCFAAPTELFSTINQRLSYMEDVALFKALNHKPIEDIEREKVVIQKASQSAQEQGLDKGSVAGFFEAQISAAKAIQYRYRADLLSQPTTKSPRDLTTVVRPELIKLGKKINQDIADYLSKHGEISDSDLATFKASLDVRYLSDNDKEALFKALKDIRLK
ncbi:chorismate mutase [Vibrio europaeus]|uniref:chorismate mutase n=1 Tax=Vibrio europaeus TaxID=300876 RepID=A0A178JF43_9VIBR|nr:chorismate mutase [Vibrio europaeus]MDC5707640.1 chorismate mutase [Vibrio europaeus]MDC5709886.1 chorismate mutase [Vibrio europaeus]MDC5716637.1 chorismate mutase [Vibrio europaeus]MDC5722743.1 chorismate mutase [Vibrio europaeus]MDC5726957.1 chorismate mutase [Vibrio europaeus]